MSKRKRMLPFWAMPASWGLNGKSRLIAEAEYYYQGDDLDYKLADINSTSDKQYEQKKLELDLKKEKIGRYEYDKAIATLNDEPYVTVLSMDIDPDIPTKGAFELDWNEQFVNYLQDNGISGMSDEDVVNTWFNGVCRTVLIQEQADMDFGLDQQQTNERPDVIRKVNPGTDSESGTS